MSRRALLLALLLAGAGCKPAPVEQPVDSGVVKVKPHLHAHNDFEHQRPLLDALDRGFDSIEADVDWMNNDVYVTHDGSSTKGTLKALYLDPLKARIDANGGSVYGDGKPLYLWIDLRDTSQPFLELLAQQLGSYDFFTSFDDAGVVQQRAVTVVLTGNATAKTALVDRPAPRPYARDAANYSEDDPNADGKWRFYGVDYRCCVFWQGNGEITQADLRRLKPIVEGAHARGRMLRFWGAPQTHDFYRVAADVGVDFIATDDLDDLSAYMKELYP